MNFTSQSEREQQLLDAIDNFKSLSKDKQEELRPLFEQTLATFKQQLYDTEIIDQFLLEYFGEVF